jgi:hypothetical protein
VRTRQHEGRGFLIRTAPDSPYAGWCGSRFLDEGLASIHAAPGRALHRLQRLAGDLPGGFALAWDHPPAWMEALHPEARAGWWEALTGVPGLALHARALPADLPGGAFRGWLHTHDAPSGPAGEAWRQGWIGWVPDTEGHWRFPDLGSAAAAEELAPGWIWGEILVPLSALANLDVDGALLPAVTAIHTRLEMAMALRMAHDIDAPLPFARRTAAWRLGLLGGAEFIRSHGEPAKAALQVKALATRLSAALRTPVRVGASGDLVAGADLGQQAMREGLPWRNSLSMPPAPSTFSPGFGADPREASPLVARASVPEALAAILDHPPAALLRVPSIPPEAGAAALLKKLHPAPALRWLPPHLPPPGPFDPDRPWADASAYPFPADPSGGATPSLFEMDSL